MAETPSGLMSRSTKQRAQATAKVSEMESPSHDASGVGCSICLIRAVRAGASAGVAAASLPHSSVFHIARTVRCCCAFAVPEARSLFTYLLYTCCLAPRSSLIRCFSVFDCAVWVPRLERAGFSDIRRARVLGLHLDNHPSFWTAEHELATHFAHTR